MSGALRSIKRVFSPPKPAPISITMPSMPAMPSMPTPQARPTIPSAKPASAVMLKEFGGQGRAANILTRLGMDDDDQDKLRTRARKLLGF